MLPCRIQTFLVHHIVPFFVNRYCTVLFRGLYPFDVNSYETIYTLPYQGTLPFLLKTSANLTTTKLGRPFPVHEQVIFSILVRYQLRSLIKTVQYRHVDKFVLSTVLKEYLDNGVREKR
jgi:hypothetical protein